MGEPGAAQSVQMPAQLQMTPFDPLSESWDCYFERFEQCMIVNNIADDKQVAWLLSVVGPAVYGILRNLASPEKPKNKTLAQLETLLSGHYSEKRITIAERFRFYAAM